MWTCNHCVDCYTFTRTKKTHTMSNFVICWSIWIIFWYLCFSFHLISMWRTIKSINWPHKKKDMRGTCAPVYNSRRRRMVRDHGSAADRGRISLVGENSEFNKENIVGLRLWHIFSLPASDNSWAYSIFFVIIWVLHPPVTFSYDAIWRGSSTCTIILS